VKERLKVEPIMLEVPVPCKIFGDIHGQYGDLMQVPHLLPSAATAFDADKRLVASTSRS
jgi:hypothetical protein